MSVPRRQPGPIKRTIVTPRQSSQSLSSNLLLRMMSEVPGPSAPGPTRRTRAVSMSGAQRDSTGKRSDWSKSQNLQPWTTPKMTAWSRTVSDFK